LSQVPVGLFVSAPLGRFVSAPIETKQPVA
jgi:hypothetical protein